MTPLDLDQRLSVPARQLGEPGPDEAQLEQLLRSAVRVPDHGKLVPWRLLLVRHAARERLGEQLATIHQRRDPQVAPAVIEKNRGRFRSAPLVVVVVARIEEDHPKIPPQEQLLSAGCVAFNLLIAAQALGFGAQWLTGWAAYDREVARLLGLSAEECVIGFVHVGSVREAVPERVRPQLADVVSEWR
jgi:nitroreductase